MEKSRPTPEIIIVEKNNRPKEEWAGNRRKNFVNYIATFIVDKNNLKLSAVLLYVPIDMKMDICPQRGHKNLTN